MFTKQATEERKQDLCIATAIAKAPERHEKWSKAGPRMDLDTAITLGWRGLRKLSFDRGPPGRLEEAMHSAESAPPNPFFMSRD
jgi:hypothetical protein